LKEVHIYNKPPIKPKIYQVAKYEKFYYDLKYILNKKPVAIERKSLKNSAPVKLEFSKINPIILSIRRVDNTDKNGKPDEQNKNQPAYTSFVQNRTRG
jgi:hypothetical protein